MIFRLLATVMRVLVRPNLVCWVTFGATRAGIAHLLGVRQAGRGPAPSVDGRTRLVRPSQSDPVVNDLRVRRDGAVRFGAHVRQRPARRDGVRELPPTPLAIGASPESWWPCRVHAGVAGSSSPAGVAGVCSCRAVVAHGSRTSVSPSRASFALHFSGTNRGDDAKCPPSGAAPLFADALTPILAPERGACGARPIPAGLVVTPLEG